MAKGKAEDKGTTKIRLTNTVGYTDPVTKRQTFYGPGDSVEVPQRLAKALGRTVGAKRAGGKDASASAKTGSRSKSDSKSDSDTGSNANTANVDGKSGSGDGGGKQ